MKYQSESAFEGGFRFLHLGFGAGGQHGELDLLEDVGLDFAAEGGAVTIGEEAFAVFVEGFFQHQAEGEVAGVVSGRLFLDGFAFGDRQRVPVDLKNGFAFNFDFVLVELADSEFVTEQFGGSHWNSTVCSIIH